LKRILLTGGFGFIGRHLLRGLQDEYEVHAPTHRELDLLDGDAVLSVLRTGTYDAVIHGATQNASRNSRDPADVVLERTLRMFYNILCGERYFGRLLYFGSGAEFDKSRPIVSAKEEEFGDRIPRDGYGFAKYVMNETALRSPNICNLRIFGCFGEYEDWEIRFISNAICKTLHGLPVTMRQNVLFDYMYVGDLPRVVRHFIETAPKYRDYNVCTGQKVDLLTIVELISQTAGRDLDVRVSTEGMNLEYTGSNRRLLGEMPDMEFTPLRQAIDRLYRWYESRLDSIDKEKLCIDK
jgi:UDP-glucose 4-epimerase